MGLGYRKQMRRRKRKDRQHHRLPVGTQHDARICRFKRYYLRYMDPHNNQALVDKKTDEYWHNVDLYVGGTELPPVT